MSGEHLGPQSGFNHLLRAQSEAQCWIPLVSLPALEKLLWLQLVTQ